MASVSLNQIYNDKLSMTPIQIQNLPKKYGMHNELLRLGSFRNWPRWAPVQPNRLARAGFFYTGSQDETMCFHCEGIVKQWHVGDRPDDRHRRVRPNCEFLLGGPTNNVPLPRPEGSLDMPEGRRHEQGNIAADDTHLSGTSVGDSEQRVTAPERGSLGTPQQRGRFTAPGDFAGNIRPLSQLNPEYQNESARLATFERWPETAYVSPEELAQAGFVYLGSGDRVQCTFCKGILRNWAPGDRAFQEHQRHFPQCAFVRNPAAANTTPAATRVIRPPGSSGANSAFSPAGGYSTASNLNELGIETDLPKHHQYAIEENRLATYNNWPADSMTQTPETLAQAGFFYTGQSDSVKCYWCDGGLRNWEAGDDPWVEHAKWFPKCGHMKRAKGVAFIEQVRRQNQSGAASASAFTTHTAFRDIDPREVTARMDTDVVTRVVGMGFERSFVRQVIEYRLRTLGDDFASAEQLLDAVLLYSEHPPEYFGNMPTSGAVGSAPTPGPAPADPPAVNAPASGETASAGKGKKKNKGKKNKGKNDESAEKGSDEKMETEEPTAKSAGDRAPECKICMDNEVSIVFLPCGHLVCCSRCAPALKNCPICRGLIKGTVNVFMA